MSQNEIMWVDEVKDCSEDEYSDWMKWETALNIKKETESL